MSISESSVIRIFDEHCHISRGKFPEVLCMDEVYTKNSTYDSKYSCIFYDFHEQRIIDVTPSRQKRYLHSYLQKIPLSERENVKYVCIDMYLPYKQLIQIYFKKATICIDSFHVIKHLNDDLQKIRIRIMKKFNTDSIEYYLLKNWKNLLFNRQMNLDNQGKYNKRLGRVVNFRQLLDMMLEIDLDLKRGYYLKEKYTIFNIISSYEEASKKMDDIINEFIKADIKEFEEFVVLLINWKQEIINSFIIHNGKRINNSIAENMNSQISVLLFNTKGIRNDERRRKRIIYAINKTNFSIR
ncbi:MAG: transposase [Traorella sp.]